MKNRFTVAEARKTCLINLSMLNCERLDRK